MIWIMGVIPDPPAIKLTVSNWFVLKGCLLIGPIEFNAIGVIILLQFTSRRNGDNKARQTTTERSENVPLTERVSPGFKPWMWEDMGPPKTFVETTAFSNGEEGKDNTMISQLHKIMSPSEGHSPVHEKHFAN